MNWNEPYMRRLKRGCVIGGLLLILGGLALVVSGTIVPGSLLPRQVRIFYTSLIWGGIGGGAGSVGMTFWLAYHPDQAKAAYVADHDERERAIWAQASKWAFWAIYYGLLLAMVVAAPLNLTVLYTLLAVFAVANLCLLIGILLGRKLL